MSAATESRLFGRQLCRAELTAEPSFARLPDQFARQVVKPGGRGVYAVVTDDGRNGGAMQAASSDTRAGDGVRQHVAAAAPGGYPDFEAFVRIAEPRLSRALAAAYGFEDGRDATAEALAYAFEHWDGPSTSRTCRATCSGSVKPEAGSAVSPCCSPCPTSPTTPLSRACPPRSPASPQRQRIAVVLVHGYGYTLREVAELTGIRLTTVQNHLNRGLARLRSTLGVTDE